MDHILTSLAFPLIVTVVGALIVALLTNAKGSGRIGAYKRGQLMTDNEKEFFGRLVVALPDHYIFPQVGMSALLDAASKHRRTAHSDRLRIAQQRVDYVVCNRQCEVVAVVELDDRTHSRAKDKVRDTRLAQAGIRTVRFESRSKPKVEAIRDVVLGSAIPLQATTARDEGGNAGVRREPVLGTKH